MAEKAGIEAPKAIKMEPVGEYHECVANRVMTS